MTHVFHLLRTQRTARVLPLNRLLLLGKRRLLRLAGSRTIHQRLAAALTGRGMGRACCVLNWLLLGLPAAECGVLTVPAD